MMSVILRMACAITHKIAMMILIGREDMEEHHQEIQDQKLITLLTA